MTDQHDERILERASAALRAPGARDDAAMADLLAALHNEAAESRDEADVPPARATGPGTRRRRRFTTTREALRFAAGLAAGIAFAAGLGLGLFAGWRMRGETYRLAAEDAALRTIPGGRAFGASDVASLRPVQFMLVAPSATRVALVGEFNDWDASATPMVRAAGGAWHVALPLSNGRHVYAFVVDGRSWVADPQAPLAPERWYGTQNSVLLVNGEHRQ